MLVLWTSLNCLLIYAPDFTFSSVIQLGNWLALPVTYLLRDSILLLTIPVFLYIKYRGLASLYKAFFIHTSMLFGFLFLPRPYSFDFYSPLLVYHNWAKFYCFRLIPALLYHFDS